MNITFDYAYFTLTIPFVILWCLIYIFSKRTRKEQVIMSVLMISIGLLLETFYFNDYWTPHSILSFTIRKFNIFIEDILFFLSIGGISTVGYEIIFRKHLIKIKNYKIHVTQTLFIILAIIIIMMFGLLALGLNSIFATSLAFIVGALLITSYRNDLFKEAIISGCIVMLIMLVSYLILLTIVTNSDEILSDGWLLYNSKLGVRFFGVPLTEMIWGFTFGMIVGPVYEFTRGYKFS